MSIQRIAYFFIVFFSLAACNNEKPLQIPDVSTDFSEDTVDLSNKLFFIGPQIDTLKMDIVADCDCCASNLAFADDRVFVFESLCLEGDDYFKGTYFKFGSLIFLKFHPMTVSSIHYPGEEKEPTWEKVSDSVSYSVLEFSTLKSEWVISGSYYGESTDYGMCNRTVPAKQFLSRLKASGVWEKLELSGDLK